MPSGNVRSESFVTMMRGQMYMSHASRNVNTPRAASAGLQRGMTICAVDPQLGSAVDAGRLDQLVRDALQILTHQEDAEPFHDERHDQPFVGVGPAELLDDEEERHHRHFERQHHRAEDQEEQDTPAKVAEFAEAVAGEGRQQQVADGDGDGNKGRCSGSSA